MTENKPPQNASSMTQMPRSRAAENSANQLSRRRLFTQLGAGATLAALSLSSSRADAGPGSHASRSAASFGSTGSYRDAALRGADWLEGQIDAQGSFGSSANDLAAYYKAPGAMQRTGRLDAAYRLLDFIKASYMQPNGDFLTAPGLKTQDPVLAQYPGYMNGWIILGAQRSARFDISLKAWSYFRGYQHPLLGASLLEGPYYNGNPSQLELLMTAHLGLMALYLGDIEAAVAAGYALIEFYDQQPKPKKRIFLRMDAAGNLIITPPAGSEFFYVVEATQPGQGWFFVGYAIAFLSILHQATNNDDFRHYARKYGDFGVEAGTNLTSEHFGHKVGWGAAILTQLSNKQAYRQLANAVAGNLLATQAVDGGWLSGAPLVTRLDQSAEVVQWLFEISALL